MKANKGKFDHTFNLIVDPIDNSEETATSGFWVEQVKACASVLVKTIEDNAADDCTVSSASLL